MSSLSSIILGEFPCSLDERYRLSIPHELADRLVGDSPQCILAKERAGCLSLWNAAAWQAKMDLRVKLLEQKIQADAFGDDRIGRVQLLGRLLSTRHKAVELKNRGRLLLPESFRRFLGVDRDPPANELLVVGAAVCVEIWNPAAWLAYLEKRMPRFRRLFHELSQ
ncbi:MAG: division/cell wall cluster transcriptional repressor MraZ [Thermoguttaceae bacterium]|jgi:MraZ protein